MRAQNPKLQVTRARNPQWYIRPYVPVLTADGVRPRQQRIFLGLCSQVTKREAILAKNQLMDKINRRQMVVQSQMKFSDFLDHYESQYVLTEDNLSASTQQKYLSHIKNHIRPAFGELRMAEVTTIAIDGWLTVKMRDGMSWATRMDLRNILCGIFTQARKWGVWKEHNPALDANVGRRRSAREKRKLSLEQTRMLLGSLQEDVRLICMVALFCTLRISEVLGLMWKHVDWSRGKLLVRQRFYRGNLDDLTKTPKSRRDVSLGILIEKLREIYPGPGHDEEFILSVKTRWGGGRFTRDDRDINQHFLRPAAKALGIFYTGFGFHAFRREAVTEYGAQDPLQAMKMAGHGGAKMTELYTLPDDQRQEEAVLRFQEKVLGEVAPHKNNVIPIDIKQASNEPRADDPEPLSPMESGGPDRTRICDLYRVKVAL